MTQHGCVQEAARKPVRLEQSNQGDSKGREAGEGRRGHCKALVATVRALAFTLSRIKNHKGCEPESEMIQLRF